MARLSLTVQKVIDNTMIFLRDRSTAYKLAITSPAGQMMYGDLLKFSRYAQGPADLDQFQTWRLIGRQDMIRRIQQHINLTDQQLFSLYNGAGFQPTVEHKDEDDE
jgi:hypothetical protein